MSEFIHQKKKKKKSKNDPRLVLFCRATFSGEQKGAE
jgi:hypothetical protein